MWVDTRAGSERESHFIMIVPLFLPAQHPFTISFPPLGYWFLLHGLEGTFCTSGKSWICLVAQTVKCLPTMWQTWLRSLGREDPLEKERAPHSSTLAWKIPWMEEPGRLQSMGSQSQIRLSNFTSALQGALLRSKSQARPVIPSLPGTGHLRQVSWRSLSQFLLPESPELLCSLPFRSWNIWWLIGFFEMSTSVQFSCLVVSYSLQPHGLQHTRLPCPSPTPRAYSNSQSNITLLLLCSH